MKSIHLLFAARPSVLATQGTTDGCVTVSLPWGVSLAAFGAAYVLLFCNSIPTFIDEAYSYNLATDKSLSHMFSALRDGADGSFPFYALTVWCWEKLFGSSELSLRLNGAIFVFLFVWHSSRRLARNFGTGIAALAI